MTTPTTIPAEMPRVPLLERREIGFSEEKMREYGRLCYEAGRASTSRHHIIAEFLESSGQYVTNDATREAAIAQATSAARQLAQEAIDSIEDWAGYASDYFREKHRLAEQLAAYRERLAGLSPAAPVASDRPSGTTPTS